MIPDPECKTWYEYGMKTAPQRTREWSDFSDKKKSDIHAKLDEILGSGWEERLCE